MRGVLLRRCGDGKLSSAALSASKSFSYSIRTRRRQTFSPRSSDSRVSLGPPTLKAGPLDALKRAEPEDTVVIYFAGHGTAQAQRFYLIPHDLGYTGERTKLTEQGLKHDARAQHF